MRICEVVKTRLIQESTISILNHYMKKYILTCHNNYSDICIQTHLKHKPSHRCHLEASQNTNSFPDSYPYGKLVAQRICEVRFLLVVSMVGPENEIRLTVLFFCCSERTVVTYSIK